MIRLSSIVLVGLLAGCGPGSPDAEPGEAGADSAASGPTDTAAVADTASAGGANAEWTVSPRGLGPINGGMSLSDAAAAVEMQPQDPTPDAECRYVTFAGMPEGVTFMVIADTIRRVDVRGPELTTDRGARVGDSASSVLARYDEGLEIMPHKYTPGGSYLIASSPDSLSRLVYEAEGDTVRRIHAGLMPQVLWVEGCS
ncbi:MAG: hypothetical protein ACRELX_03290 [Longimicrobiales bacterium]